MTPHMATPNETCHHPDVRVPRKALFSIFASTLAAACGDESGGLAPIAGDGTFDPEILDFGTQPIGDTYSRPAVIRNLGAESVVVKDVRFEPESDVFAARQADGSALRGASIGRGGRRDLAVLFAPVEERDYSTTMIATLGDVEVALPIKAFGRSARLAMPSVDPSTVVFVDVAVGRDVSQRVTLTNSGEAPGILREIRPMSAGSPTPFSVRTPGGGNPVPSQPISGDGSEPVPLEVHFAPTAAGTFLDRFELHFDDGEPAVLVVRGTAVPAGLLTCDVQMIQFGAVPRGTTVERPVHCTASEGQFSLARIGTTPATPELFSIPNPPLGLAPDRSLDFTVEFESQGLSATHAGMIEIAADHGAITRIALSGEVTPPPVGMTDLTISLRWDTALTDFDLHLVRNGSTPFDTGNDCYFAMKNPDWGQVNVPDDDPFLDRDATDGLGPEVINLGRSAEMFYDAYVHFYTYTAAQAPPTQVTIEYGIRGGAAQSATLTMAACGSTWHVGRFRFDVSPPVFEPDTLITDDYRSRSGARCQ